MYYSYQVTGKRMENNNHFHTLSVLEDQINVFLEQYQELLKENQALKQQQNSLSVERAELVEKNMQVQSKIESMVNQLKNLEKSV